MICQSLANQASSSRDAADCSTLGTLLCPAGFNFPMEPRSAMSFEEQRRLLDGQISEICCGNLKETVTGTDADPFDPQRGLAYRYIGWSLMHKTPKMIEAGALRGIRFATGSHSVVKGNSLCGRPRPPLGPGCDWRVKSYPTGSKAGKCSFRERRPQNPVDTVAPGRNMVPRRTRAYEL